MGLIQNKLRQNSFQSMSFLFFSIFIWHGIIDIIMFPIYLSIATKEIGGAKDRFTWDWRRTLRNDTPSIRRVWWTSLPQGVQPFPSIFGRRRMLEGLQSFHGNTWRKIFQFLTTSPTSVVYV